MATQSTTQNGSEPCGCCDLHDIEELSCSAKRFAQQAQVAADSAARLTGFQTQYGTARSQYQAARDAAEADLTATKRKLKDLIDDLQCRLPDEVEDCVDSAFDRVVVEIRECAGEPGCCVGEGDFDPPGDDETADQLAGRIDKYRREMASVEKCFTDLIGEAAAIPGRAADLKAEVESIITDSHADEPDLARLYARALIAAWRLRWEQLWKGYRTVNDYVECLCRALQRALQGWECIAILEGRKAELDCQADGRAAACARKQADIIDEVMKWYLCTCPPEDDDDHGDCGCGKHHHARGDDDREDSSESSSAS